MQYANTFLNTYRSHELAEAERDKGNARVVTMTAVCIGAWLSRK